MELHLFGPRSNLHVKKYGSIWDIPDINGFLIKIATLRIVCVSEPEIIMDFKTEDGKRKFSINWGAWQFSIYQ